MYNLFAKLVFFTLSFFVATNFSFPNDFKEWYKVGQDLKSMELNSIAVQGDSLIIAVGNNGAIKLSNDKGDSFDLVHGDYKSMDLLDVAFMGSKIITCGKYGTILLSNDTGKTWEDISLSIDENLNAIATDSNNVIFVGDNGIIYISDISLNEWKRVDIEFKENFSDIIYINDHIFYAIGTIGLLIKTDDNGKNWHKIETYTNSDFTCFSNEFNGRILFGGKYNKLFELDLQTDDISDISTENTPYQFEALLIIDDNIVLAGINGAGFDEQGYTTDGGKTWEISTSTDTPNNSIQLNESKNVAYLVGIEGSVIKIKIDNVTFSLSNGSQFFNEYIERGNQKQQNFDLQSNNTDFLLSKINSSLYKSIDSAISWIDMGKPISNYILESFDLISEKDILTLNRKSKKRSIVKSTNGGNSWDLKYEVEDNTQKKIIYDPSGFCVVIGTYNKFLLSTNYGDSWTSSETPNDYILNDINIIDSSTLYSFSMNSENKNYFVKTYNNCQTWDLTPVDLDGFEISYPVLCFININFGWLVFGSKWDSKKKSCI